ncbi:hypothetical protein [Nitrospira sp. BLG_1]|uniref:hypothetical protein n=1 Tax=Nitrospira sp. BLG_1 TaxID=3395883 RepID=UPI0039BC63C7
MVTRYFDVDPTVVGLAYGMDAFLAERRRIDEIQHAKAEAAKAKRKRALIMGGTAAAAAVTAGLAAPALGLAGTAASAGGLGGVEAGALGGALPTAATSGILGTGGTVGLGGYLTAASIGAQAGGAFSEGDVAGGMTSLAAPFVMQQQRNMAREDRDYNRRGALSDAITLDTVRSANDLTNSKAIAEIHSKSAIDQTKLAHKLSNEGYLERTKLANQGALDQEQLRSDLKNYGMPAADYISNQSAVAGYDQQAANENMPFGMGPPAVDQEDNPYVEGPSKVAGMDRKYSGASLIAKAQIARRRAATIGNPDWVNSNSPDMVAAERRAIARADSHIQTSLVPHTPTFQEQVQSETSIDDERGVIWERGAKGQPVSKPLPERKIEWSKLTPEQQEQQRVNFVGGENELRDLRSQGGRVVPDGKGGLKIEHDKNADVVTDEEAMEVYKANNNRKNAAGDTMPFDPIEYAKDLSEVAKQKKMRSLAPKIEDINLRAEAIIRDAQNGRGDLETVVKWQQDFVRNFGDNPDRLPGGKDGSLMQLAKRVALVTKDYVVPTVNQPEVKKRPISLTDRVKALSEKDIQTLEDSFNY